MDENKIVIEDDGNLKLAINNMLIDLSNLFATTYHVIEKKTLNLTSITFSYTLAPSEDMQDVIIAVQNSVYPDNEFVKTISVDKLADLTRTAFASGVFLGNSPDFYSYLKDLVYEIYNQFLKEQYVMLDDITSNSNCIVFKNSKAILAVNDCHSSQNKFFAVSAFDSSDKNGPLIYMNLTLDKTYYSFYEKPYEVLMGYSHDKANTGSDATKSTYEFVFASPHYDEMLILTLSYKNKGYKIEKIAFEDDYRDLKDVVLNHYNDLPEILDAAAELNSDPDVVGLLDFLD